MSNYGQAFSMTRPSVLGQIGRVLSSRPRGGPVTGQQMQDDRRAAMQGYQNIRGPGGNLVSVLSPSQVNARKALAMADAPSAMLTPQQREFKAAGEAMRNMLARADQAAIRQNRMADLTYRDNVENFRMRRDQRQRTRQDWGFEDEKRSFQRDMWKRARNAGNGSVSSGSVGGSYSVAGLR